MTSKAIITGIILMIVGLIIFGALVEQAGWSIHGSTVTNESINFAVNNTWYQPSRSPINTLTRIGNNTITANATTDYTFDAILGIKIYTNSTKSGSENLTAGDYDVSYTIVKPSGFASVIMGLFIGVVALVLILMYLKKI